MCNLKSHKTLKEILEYKNTLGNLNKEGVEFVLFPTALYLPFFYDAPYKIGSQDVSFYDSGSHTGEILASQLKSTNVSYVLVNHMERNEEVDTILSKMKNAIQTKIKVVLCVGEKTRQTMDESIDELKKEIHKIFDRLAQNERENIILAYEPFWAIQQKEIVSLEVLENIIKKIKEDLENKYSLSLPIVYGGGINCDNILNLAKIDALDGYLLGKSAKSAENICKILNKL